MPGALFSFIPILNLPSPSSVITFFLYLFSSFISCRKNFLQDDLQAFQFHHKDENNDIKSSETSKKIINYEYNPLKEWIQKEKGVALYGNCHKMLHSKHFVKKSK